VCLCACLFFWACIHIWVFKLYVSRFALSVVFFPHLLFTLMYAHSYSFLWWCVQSYTAMVQGSDSTSMRTNQELQSKCRRGGTGVGAEWVFLLGSGISPAPPRQRTGQCAASLAGHILICLFLSAARGFSPELPRVTRLRPIFRPGTHQVETSTRDKVSSCPRVPLGAVPPGQFFVGRASRAEEDAARNVVEQFDLRAPTQEGKIGGSYLGLSIS